MLSRAGHLRRMEARFNDILVLLLGRCDSDPGKGMMVEDKAKGAGIDTEEINAGHGPFINMPEAVASSIQKVAN
jgi:hypothetical protein